jgi:hypothetical protein
VWLSRQVALGPVGHALEHQADFEAGRTPIDAWQLEQVTRIAETKAGSASLGIWMVL